MSLTKVSFSMINGEVINVLDYGADKTGVQDSTNAIQNAINASIATGTQVFLPAGQYLVTSTINIPPYTNLIGEYNYQGWNDSTNTTSTVIQFKPATAQSLFVASGSTVPEGGFRSYYRIEGIFINGNSSTNTGNSIYAIDANLIIYSLFKNLKIWGFRTGIKCTQTINNRFENVEIGYSTISCVMYQGSTCTTDVWEQCTFNLSVLGVDSEGASNSIRFNNCLFEDLDNGINIAKECSAWSFTNCYSENIPRTNTAGSIFQVGYTGSVFAVAPALSIIGGTYLGNDTYTSSVGTWLSNNGAYSIYIANPFVTNIETVIYNTLSAKDNSLIFSGLTLQNYTTLIYQRANTVQGFLTDESLNGGYGNEQNMFTQYTYAKIFDTTGTTLFVGPNASPVYLGKASGLVSPYTGASEDLGSSGNRWNNIFLVNAPNVSSDASLKTVIGSLTDTEKAVAIKIKALFKTYKYNQSIEEKGDKARIHVGVIAQEVQEAFVSEGLDPFKYSLFCQDISYEIDGKTHDGNGVTYDANTPDVQSVSRLSIRYEELLAFVISAI